MTLSSEIEDRKAEAGRKKIAEKGEKVAKIFGRHRSLNGGGTEGDEYTFEGSNLKIKSTFGGTSDGMGFSGLEIWYHGDLVFKEGGVDIYSFIPGAWEGILTRKANEANREEPKVRSQLEAACTKTAAAAEETERSLWGL